LPLVIIWPLSHCIGYVGHFPFTGMEPSGHGFRGGCGHLPLLSGCTPLGHGSGGSADGGHLPLLSGCPPLGHVVSDCGGPGSEGPKGLDSLLLVPED
jgi:hypothetical protein